MQPSNPQNQTLPGGVQSLNNNPTLMRQVMRPQMPQQSVSVHQPQQQMAAAPAPAPAQPQQQAPVPQQQGGNVAQVAATAALAAGAAAASTQDGTVCVMGKNIPKKYVYIIGILVVLGVLLYLWKSNNSKKLADQQRNAEDKERKDMVNGMQSDDDEEIRNQYNQYMARLQEMKRLQMMQQQTNGQAPPTGAPVNQNNQLTAVPAATQSPPDSSEDAVNQQYENQMKKMMEQQ